MAIKTVYIDEQRQPHNYKAEIAALVRLNGSPGIVPLLDQNVQAHAMDPEANITMPALRFTLDDIIFNSARAKWPPNSGWTNLMPQVRAREIIRKLAIALESVHAAGIVHRDIRPENVLFATQDSEPLLADFGIAYVPGVSPADEEPGSHAGTSDYRAPEVLLAVPPFSEKVDIWGLGCLWAKLASKDCEGAFGPYTNELALLGNQRMLLGSGSPQRLFADMTPSGNQDSSTFDFRVRFDSANILRVLSIDPEKRPSAQEISSTLSQVC